MEEILNTILKDTYSLTALTHKLSVLKTYLLQTLFNGEQKEFAQQDLTWLQSLPAAFLQNFNKNNIYDIFSNLEKQKNGLKILTLYLTFDPDDQTLAQIGDHVRKSFNSLMLLDIKFDPNLIAGAAVVWKGIRKIGRAHV